MNPRPARRAGCPRPLLHVVAGRDRLPKAVPAGWDEPTAPAAPQQG
jgi:hypothetical protein